MISKADFRAARDRCGLTQQDVAKALKVTDQTVRRWERDDNDWLPEDAVEWMLDRLQEHRIAVEAALDAAHEAIEVAPEGSAIILTYFRSQRQYDDFGRDPGNHFVVDARTREVAAILEAEGHEVRFAYPGAEAVSTPGSRY